MKDYADKNYNRKTGKAWRWAITIAWIAVMFMLLSRIDTVLFGYGVEK